MIPVQLLSELDGLGAYLGDQTCDIPFKRQFGPVDIDPGPYCCYVEGCLRLSGFRTQDALDTHIRRFH